MERIVSGGQTGADRAALDFAKQHGIPHKGWCPQGRLAEDGPIPDDYALQETPTPTYAERTEWNVRDSDGTVVFSVNSKLSGGSRATVEFAVRLGRPCLHVSEERDGAASVVLLRRFLQQHRIRVLNVAGPRESNEPTVANYVVRVLGEVLALENSPDQNPSSSGRKNTGVDR